VELSFSNSKLAKVLNSDYLFQPDYAIPPGETLAETLEQLGMSQAGLAQRMGRPLQMISEIIQGKKAITAETALQLERATGVPANFWNSSQRNYEATLARLEEERRLAPDSSWLKQLENGKPCGPPRKSPAASPPPSRRIPWPQPRGSVRVSASLSKSAPSPTTRPRLRRDTEAAVPNVRGIEPLILILILILILLVISQAIHSG